MRRLLVFAILQLIKCSCPDGWELAGKGECRGFVDKLENFRGDEAAEAAISKCKAIQADLPIIHNDEQQTYWANTRKTSKPIPIALVCNSSSRKWYWSDGSAIDYRPDNEFLDYVLDGEPCRPDCIWYIHDSSGNWDYMCDSSVYPYDVFCTTHLPPLPIPSADGCESFEDDKDDGVCYQVGAAAENWQDAQRSCSNLGANLASIHNEQENAFVRRLAVSKGAVNGLFLGATVSGKGNQFGWIDGTEWDYNNFYPGFPVNGLGDCLAMDTQGTSGQWMNANCNSNYSVACVRPQGQGPSSSTCSSGPWNEGQIITSPGFPFDASIPCDYFLIADAGKNVEVEIWLEANSCCDRLIINDNLMGGNVVANLTGEVSKKTFTTTSSNLMRVSWQPNGAVNVRGLMMTFRGV